MEPIGIEQLLSEVKERFIPSLYLDETKRKPKAAQSSFFSKSNAVSPTIDGYWSETFYQFFVRQSTDKRDDLLFYVKYDEKAKKEDVDVIRRDSKLLPDMTDSSILWDHTLYLNILMHEFNYKLTVSLLNPKQSTSSERGRVNKQVSMTVYPSLTRRRMDKKSKKSDMTYPSLMFYIDNYEEAFQDIQLSTPGQKVAVQIKAMECNSPSPRTKIIFVGGLEYSVLKGACLTKQKEKESPSLQTRLKQFSKRRKSRINFYQHQYTFIPMIGPNDKGNAEMAVYLSMSDMGTGPLTSTGISPHLGTDVDAPIKTNGHSTGVAIATSTDRITLNDTLESIPDDSCIETPPQLEEKSFEDQQNDKDTCRDIINDQNMPTTPNSSSDLPIESDGKDSSLSPPHTSRGAESDVGTSVDKETFEHTDNGGERDVVNAHLTFVELPWYTVIEDILFSTRAPAF